jgi:hypothetical protein
MGKTGNGLGIINVPSSLVLPEMKGILANLPSISSSRGDLGMRSPSMAGEKMNLES